VPAGDLARMNITRPQNIQLNLEHKSTANYANLSQKIIAFSALTRLVEHQEENPARKN